ncbi:MAG: hypothetical protein GY811_30360 [Myxococcales bacterium]|nr:hypothetical protein [Myxococcales bacterium]
MKCMLASSFILAAVSCGGAPTTPVAPGEGAGGEAATRVRTNSEVDALWALAPSDTAVGMVVAPGTTLRLYEMAEELLRVVEARPLGREATREAREKMGELPFNVFDSAAFGSAGIHLGQGAALFLDSKENVTIVLPVSNRDKFRSFSDAVEHTANGRSFDKLGDGFYCTNEKSLYVCMETPEQLTNLLEAGLSSFSEKVYALPASYRGDAEMVMDVAAFGAIDGEIDEELDELFSEIGLIAGVLQMDAGSMTARLWLQGKPRGDMKAVVDASTEVGGLSAEIAGLVPSTLMRMIVPMQMVADEVREQTLPGGLSLKRDIVQKMTGEFVAYAPSSKSPWGRFALGITEAEGFRGLLNMGCTMIPPMEFLEVTPGTNRCDLLVDYDKVPNLDPEVRSILHGKNHLSIAVLDDQLSLTLGHESAPFAGSRVSAIGRELLEKEWSYSFWTQNFSIISGFSRPWSTVLSAQPGKMQEGMRYALWLLAHVSEFAVAMSVQPDGMHLMAHVGTYASDTDDAYHAYQAAVTKNIDEGDTRADFEAIRTKWPQSLSGQQSAVPSSVSAILAGLIANVSVPAYVKYLERAAAPEPFQPKR